MLKGNSILRQSGGYGWGAAGGASNFRQDGFSEKVTLKLLSEDEKVLAMRV